MKRVKYLLAKTSIKVTHTLSRLKTVLCDQSGDQLTGWMIVILLVVVVGAVFLNTYQNAILDIWNGIIDKAKRTFGI